MLTLREKEVIEALWKSQGDRQLACQALKIKSRTLETHLSNIYTKKKVKDLLRLFFKLGKIQST